MTARYLKTHSEGQLSQRAAKAKALLASCTLCPRECAVDRLSDELGFCRTGRLARVASYDAHFGEESPLVGTNGSGTIFFTNCNLGCIFCQNYDISHDGVGHAVDDAELAAIMLALQNAGCHNINFVTPSHVVPQILSALCLAADQGLKVPLVYNSGGYDSTHTLRLLDGVVDIYMPDFKFWDDDLAHRMCQADDYRQTACDALMEMQRQVGELTMDERGIARHGLLVRHLVMPRGLAGTEQIMTFIAQNISKDTYVNIMPQYRPMGKIDAEPSLNRSITGTEYAEALKAAKEAGIQRLDQRRRVFGLF